jgi:hypothetical protein
MPQVWHLNSECTLLAVVETCHPQTSTQPTPVSNQWRCSLCSVYSPLHHFLKYLVSIDYCVGTQEQKSTKLANSVTRNGHLNLQLLLEFISGIVTKTYIFSLVVIKRIFFQIEIWHLRYPANSPK